MSFGIPWLITLKNPNLSHASTMPFDTFNLQAKRLMIGKFFEPSCVQEDIAILNFQWSIEKEKMGKESKIVKKLCW